MKSEPGRDWLYWETRESERRMFWYHLRKRIMHWLWPVVVFWLAAYLVAQRYGLL